jgi:hypothetical protein
MKVRIFEQQPTGSKEIGVLVLREGIIMPEPPDSIPLNNMLAEPAMLLQGNERVYIDPKSQPEAFLKALSKLYHGTHFFAGEVED